MKKLTILCVDDDLSIISSLRTSLRNTFGEEFRYEFAESGAEGIEIFEEYKSENKLIPLIISDHSMPNMDGVEFLSRIDRLSPDTKKILLTGGGSKSTLSRAVNEAKIFRFIEKPWDHEVLMHSIREAIELFLINHNLKQRLQLSKNLNDLAQIMVMEIEPLDSNNIIPMITSLDTRFEANID